MNSQLAGHPYNARRKEGRPKCQYDIVRKNIGEILDLDRLYLRSGGHVLFSCSIIQIFNW